MFTASGFHRTPVLGFSSFLQKTETKASRDYKCIAQQTGVSHGFRKSHSKYSFLSSRSLTIHGKVKHGSASSTLLKDGNPTITTSEEDSESLGIMGLDPGLGPFEDHLRYRSRKYLEQKKLIETYEGSLHEFSLGYLKFGFNREQDGIVY